MFCVVWLETKQRGADAVAGVCFQGVCFFNYEAWLNGSTHIRPNAYVVWPIVSQEILNVNVGPIHIGPSQQQVKKS
uniref:Uncharacterized protein n=1 Tax=Gossypium raimondii TaxID=29730 RepID=A0A0D2U7P7_GOSRA|nr:hypothetical protein B456_013G269000 [Gossypium raimondii]